MPELLAAVSFEASNPLPRCGSLPDEASPDACTTAPESLAITAGDNNVRPRSFILGQSFCG